MKDTADISKCGHRQVCKCARHSQSVHLIICFVRTCTFAILYMGAYRLCRAVGNHLLSIFSKASASEAISTSDKKKRKKKRKTRLCGQRVLRVLNGNQWDLHACTYEPVTIITLKTYIHFMQLLCNLVPLLSR